MPCRRLTPTPLFGAAILLVCLLGGYVEGRAVCTESVLFAPATHIPTIERPRGVAVADLDGDGILDLIVTHTDGTDNSFGHSIAVRKGNGSGGVGDGTFGPPTVYGTGNRPHTIVVADFNEDGNPDLAITNLADGTISVFLGVGGGNYVGSTTFPCGPRPYGMVTGDLDGDGILDLAVANNGTATVGVLRGLGSGGAGNGSFTGPTFLPISHNSTGIAIGDVNLDGRPDLVASANYNHEVAVLLNLGGTFASAVHYAAGVEPFDPLVRDVTNDGKPDLLVANSNSGGVAVLIGNGDGTFGAATLFGSGMNCGAIAAGDFNQDGRRDVAVSNLTNGTVAVLIGQGGGVGNGTFLIQGSYGSFNFPLGLAVADLNEDGSEDIVVGNYLGATVGLLFGSCGTPPPVPEQPVLVSVRDVPNDQGGCVFLRWTRSSLDAPGGPGISGYRVWRRLPLGGLASSQAQGRGPSLHRVGVTYWEALVTLPAEHLEGYGYTAPTTQDSMAGSNPYTAFFVTALTNDADVFYESNVDSGYSVDNLAPPMPFPFVAVYSGGSNTLHWTPSPAADWREFRLYRGSSETFVPGPGNLVASTADTGYVDSPGLVYYKLAALDIHGNVSRYALVSPAAPTAVLATLVEVRADADRVKLVWYSGANQNVSARVYRRTRDSDWTLLRTVLSDSRGYWIVDDTSIQPDTEYGYRLGLPDADAEVLTQEIWVSTRSLAFELFGARPNPASRSQLEVEFVLPTFGSAKLELIDVTGRRVLERSVGELGPGRHHLRLAGSGLAPGVYQLRLRQGGREATQRVVLIE